MTSMDVAALDGKKLLRRWLMGFFGVMFAANGVFLWFALTTHTGESTKNAYEEGRLYNTIIAADARLDELGWQMDTEQSGDSLLIRFLDGGGLMLDGQVVSAQLFRPSSARQDRALVLSAMSAGQFSADIAGVAGGHWQLRVRYAVAGEILELRREIEIG